VKQILWSPQAIRDVESIRAFIAQDSPAYAELIAERLVSAVERLQEFPESGRIVPERQNSAIREVIAPPYRIVYRLRGSFVEIATVFRSARQFPKSF
jgi:toxin ParE1/3/4